MPNNPVEKNISEIKKIYLFDLDGVLIDSKKICNSRGMISVKNNINVPFSNYFSLIGLPFIQILKKLRLNKNTLKILNMILSQFDKNLKYIKIHKGV